MKNYIRKYIVKNNTTQRELAKQVGIGESAVSRYVNGTRIPSGDILIKMAKILKTKAENLIGEDI